METHFAAMEVQKKEAEALGYLFAKPDEEEELASFIEKYGCLIRKVTLENMEDSPSDLVEKILSAVEEVMNESL